MTSIEDQLRLYAGAITDERPQLPLPDRSRPPAPRHHRGVFALAAAALVIVLLVGATVALRGGDGPQPVTTTTTSEGQIVTELSLSTDAPAPDEMVTATLTITNNGDTDVTLPRGCGGQVTLTKDPKPTSFGQAGSTFFEINLDAALSFGNFATEPAPLTSLDELLALLTSPEQASADGATCTAPTTIGGGERRRITSRLAVGALGMEPGPGLVSTTFFGDRQPPNVSIPITIPAAPDGVLTRAQAVERALAEPSVQETIASLPGSGDVGSTQAGVFIAWPVDDGWQVGYAQSTGQAFLVTLTPDAIRIDRAGTSP